MGQGVYFSDVVLADILTSLAKVMGDIWLSLLMLVPNGSLLAPPVQEGWLQWIVPLTMCLPYAARLRQCVIEYFASSSPSNKRALVNALKYSTSFPVIFLSAAQRLVESELAVENGPEVLHSPWHGEHPLLLAVVVNSVFSFWWDVTNDWGLSMLQSPSEHQTQVKQQPSSKSTQNENGSRTDHPYPETKYPNGLRPILLFNDPFVYYAAIGLNFVLRFTWSLKLSSHLHTLANMENGIFILEALELIRRWIWVFFRIEWEAVKKGGATMERTLVNEEVEIDTIFNAVT
ncbi:hypothetical protein Clacol_000666 [Clathrus columnatus]|uniref:EXS domain-containing protein n=1 Tax=Clathrus columnatus TaxID=1419009 RepID=A0AAV5A174_9AGAM|nr:hypothetical protein Clacol_000666 [Clathrus columnatus]